LINSSVDGDSIILRKDINIGVAVALENGLIVPVVKHAAGKDFAGLARAVNDLSNRRGRKNLRRMMFRVERYDYQPRHLWQSLRLPDYHQPQVAILGVGAIKKRPVVIDDAIAIRSMVYISMSYDHRIIDGALGGMFCRELSSIWRILN